MLTVSATKSQRWVPRDYMVHIVTETMKALTPETGVGLLLDPGMGKTSITLAVIRQMISSNKVQRVLLVAPLRVCYEVWRQEAKKWLQFQGTKFSLVHGPEKKRIEALREPAEVFLVPFSSAAWLSTWLLDHPTFPRFTMLVVDESSKIKGATTVVSRAIRRMSKNTPFRLILTGSPIPHSMADLWAQVFVLDWGRRLEPNITLFRARYCTSTGYMGYGHKLVNGAAERIRDKIADCCFSLRAKDHLTLPPLILNEISISLDPAARAVYDEIEQQMFSLMEGIPEGKEIQFNSAGAKYAACRQAAAGVIYTDAEEGVSRPGYQRESTVIHRQKIEAIADLDEELGGKPIIVVYETWAMHKQLVKLFPKASSINSRTKPETVSHTIQAWNQGRITHLLVHPQSLSHGVNMQAGPGRDIVWVEPPNIGEAFTQLNCRIWRQGVTGTVRIHLLVARDTVDELARDRLNGKISDQESLLDSLRRYKAGKTGGA